MNSSNGLLGCFGCLVIIFILLFGAITVIPDTRLIKTTDNGEQYGYVVSVDKSGILFKKHTLYVKSDNESSETITFCFDKDNGDLAKEIQGYAKNNQRVVINYESYLLTGFNWCEWIVTDVDPI